MESDIKAQEHFKSQFKALQEQQQRKLQNLMERKKDKQSSQKVNNGNAKETFGILNDLNLFETEQPVTEDDSKRYIYIRQKSGYECIKSNQDLLLEGIHQDARMLLCRIAKIRR